MSPINGQQLYTSFESCTPPECASAAQHALRALDLAPEQEDGQTVLGLELMPNGPIFWFPRTAPVHVLRVGQGAHNDIIVHGRYVTDTHCLLLITPNQVQVRDFGHSGETLVNNVAVTDGHAILHAGSVLQLGRQGQTRLMARSAEPGQLPEMVVHNLYEMVQQASSYHGSKHKAAKALGVKPRTFRRWITEHKFKIVMPLAVLLTVVSAMSMQSKPAATVPASVLVLPAAVAPGMPAAVAPGMPAAVENPVTTGLFMPTTLFMPRSGAGSAQSSLGMRSNAPAAHSHRVAVCRARRNFARPDAVRTSDRRIRYVRRRPSAPTSGIIIETRRASYETFVHDTPRDCATAGRYGRRTRLS